MKVSTANDIKLTERLKGGEREGGRNEAVKEYYTSHQVKDYPGHRFFYL